MAKTSVLISGLAAVAVIGGLAYWMFSADETRVPIPTPNEDIKNKNAIANHWQWENFTDTKSAPEPIADRDNAEVEKPRPTGEVPYDVVEIYNILQSIQLDEYGRVVPDQTAKEALENAFLDLGPDLSPEAMAELQDLIRIGLPGGAGEEAARVLEDYYQFRLAEEEFNRYLPQDGQAPTIERYEELVQLRRRYLGDEVADKLFAVEDAQARHMYATFAIQQDADLTDEEKQSQQAALQKQLSDRLLALGHLGPEEAATEKVRLLREQGASSADIYSAREAILGPERARELAAADREEAQWQNRFDRFWQARQQVMQADLDEVESERQIEQLLGQYFSPEERERARLTSYEWEARESE
jgi:lipase chaperone LimK